MLASTFKSDEINRAQVLDDVERHLLTIDRDEAVIRVEIWAEASRNPTVAASVETHERTAWAWMLDMTASGLSSARATW